MIKIKIIYNENQNTYKGTLTQLVEINKYNFKYLKF